MAAHFGMIGLGTMGSNLVLNIADHGFAVCGYDRDPEQGKRLINEANGKDVSTASSMVELVKNLAAPRAIMLLVPAGVIVDAVLKELIPLLEKGDIVLDGGNSHFMDTERRYRQFHSSGFHFIGMGVSGGEEGARFGPSLMPGGNQESFARIKTILEAIAAKTEDGPCVAYIGNTAAGHYTKMVHNGIEYALMQLISEVYGILKTAGNYNNEELYHLFTQWNQTDLQSFLIEITSDIFLKKDDDTGELLIDLILDKAKQKGTGLWTSQSALDLNVPIPVIDMAVSMRYLSALKDERVVASQRFRDRTKKKFTDKEKLENLCRDALHFAFLIAYGQGLQLLSVASAMYNYHVDIAEVLRVWKGGCIIRSSLLNELRNAYIEKPSLSNMILSPKFTHVLTEKRSAIIQLLKIAMDAHQPSSCLSASLNYFDAYTSENLPANLIQAQRDHFGAHTYERKDKEGNFHTIWIGKPPVVTSTQKTMDSNAEK